jgi:hypothetical protein
MPVIPALSCAPAIAAIPGFLSMVSYSQREVFSQRASPAKLQNEMSFSARGEKIKEIQPKAILSES